MSPIHPVPANITEKVIGAAMKVHRELGSGLREKPYENALCIELRDLDFEVRQQHPFPIRYGDHIVGECLPDITLPKYLLIEAKATDGLTDADRAQLLNYLRISGFGLGLLFNFKTPSLEFKRCVL